MSASVLLMILIYQVMLTIINTPYAIQLKIDALIIDTIIIKSLCG